MKIKNVKVYGLEESIIRSGYPMQIGEPEIFPSFQETHKGDIGDYARANKLARTPVGSGHNNFLKGIIVQLDLQYPQYLTPQLQRYHWFEIISSQSKMHKLTSVKNISTHCNKYVLWKTVDIVNDLISAYNLDSYPVIIESRLLENNEDVDIVCNSKDELFQYVVSNLPMGYEMWMGISTNYLQLKTIYNQRKNHKLEEWKEFCRFIESLPFAKELILNE